MYRAMSWLQRRSRWLCECTSMQLCSWNLPWVTSTKTHMQHDAHGIDQPSLIPLAKSIVQHCVPVSFHELITTEIMQLVTANILRLCSCCHCYLPREFAAFQVRTQNKSHSEHANVALMANAVANQAGCLDHGGQMQLQRSDHAAVYSATTQ